MELRTHQLRMQAIRGGRPPVSFGSDLARRTLGGVCEGSRSIRARSANRERGATDDRWRRVQRLWYVARFATNGGIGPSGRYAIASGTDLVARFEAAGHLQARPKKGQGVVPRSIGAAGRLRTSGSLYLS